MLINLLGPVEAVTADGAVGLGGAKQRAVLAMLALQTGSTVSADRLIDGLWGDQPPASALKLVQLYVSHLRKALGEEDVITTHGRGYELRLARHEVDAGRFERLLAQGAAREALRLWRGSPLSDVAGRAVRGAGDPPPRRAPHRGARGRHRPGPRRRPPSRGAAGDRRAARGRAAARATPRPPHARPVSLRPPGRRARGLPRGAAHADRADRCGAGPGAARAPRGHPAPGSRPRSAGRRRGQHPAVRP